MPQEGTKVLVAMSGGVDSSVAAALLKKSDYDVTGAFIKVWYPEWLPCSWREDRTDAMRVCATLGIPFITINASKEYKRDVIAYMIDEYKAGRTPNPDVMCNKMIKFGAFLRDARSQRADYIATGHHVRIDRRPMTNDQRHKKLPVAGCRLLVGTDSAKDQSYFLWTLTQDVLAKTLFPVGEYTKDEVRSLAKKFGLHNAEKKDSQGLCFIGHVHMQTFLKHYIETDRGDVLDMRGNTIGIHNGAPLYTIGQRHGFTVTTKTPTSSPSYVVDKDLSHNTITVSESYTERHNLGIREVVLKDTNWIGDMPESGKRYNARIRYRQTLQSCRIEETRDKGQGTNTWRVVFDEAQHGVASGQSCVLYMPAGSGAKAGDGEECLGGGVIY